MPVSRTTSSSASRVSPSAVKRTEGAEIIDGYLVITLKANTVKPPLSGTGKSRVVATSNGFMNTEAEVDGQTVRVSVNAIISK